MLFLIIAVALPGVPLIHSASSGSAHVSTDVDGTVTITRCHTTAGDPRHASGDHVYQCSLFPAILSGIGPGASIRNHGPHRLPPTGPYTSPAFAPAERPPIGLI